MKPIIWTIVATLISDCTVSPTKIHEDTHNFSVNNSPFALKQSKYFCDFQLPDCNRGGIPSKPSEEREPSYKGSVGNIRGKKKSRIK